MEKTTFKRAKIGLNKTDKRITHERLTELKTELERQIKHSLDYPLTQLTKTRKEGKERRYRILLTAINILISHLNYLNNEKKTTSFRNSANVAKGYTSKISDRKNVTSGNGDTARLKRSDRVSIRRPITEYVYNYVRSN